MVAAHEQYQAASKDQKNAIVMRYLNSPAPDVRAVFSLPMTF